MGWVDSDADSDLDVGPAPPVRSPPSSKSEGKRRAQDPSPASPVSRKVSRCRPWLDDRLLPGTVDDPILDRLCTFVKKRNAEHYDRNAVSSIAMLLMTLMTTRTDRYSCLESLLRYLNSSYPSEVLDFLRERVILEEFYRNADEEYVQLCYTAVATFAAI
jgi:hypothetical protein